MFHIEACIAIERPICPGQYFFDFSEGFVMLGVDVIELYISSLYI
jgi:hypothetical protein